MSGRAMAWAKRQQIADGGLKGVLVVLAWRANASGVLWRSQDVLAEECGVSARSLRRSLLALEQLKIISRKARSNGRKGRSSDLITLTMDEDFDVSKSLITGLRRAPTTGQNCRLPNILQPDNSVDTTGQVGQGKNRDQAQQRLAIGKATKQGQVSTAAEGPIFRAQTTPLRLIAGEAAR